jgi:hypothetical protein
MQVMAKLTVTGNVAGTVAVREVPSATLQFAATPEITTV